MRACSKCPKVDSSSSGAPPPPPPPSTSGDLAADAYVDPTTTAAPPPSASDVFNIHRDLDTVITVQAAHGQLLVNVLTELQALRVDLVSFRRSPSLPPFDNE